MQACLFHIGAVHIKVSWSGLGGLSHLSEISTSDDGFETLVETLNCHVL